MAKFAVKTLEFEKIKEALGEETATSLGKNLAMELKSSTIFGEVKLLQEETAQMMRIQSEGKRLPLGGASDVSAALKRAKVGSVLEVESMLAIGNTAAAIRQVKAFLEENKEIAPNLAEYGLKLGDFSRLEKQINSAIDEKGEVKDTASTKLSSLRTGIYSAKKKVKEKLDSILHDPINQKYFQDQIVTMREDRYVIPVNKNINLISRLSP